VRRQPRFQTVICFCNASCESPSHRSMRTPSPERPLQPASPRSTPPRTPSPERPLRSRKPLTVFDSPPPSAKLDDSISGTHANRKSYIYAPGCRANCGDIFLKRNMARKISGSPVVEPFALSTTSAAAGRKKLEKMCKAVDLPVSGTTADMKDMLMALIKAIDDSPEWTTVEEEKKKKKEKPKMYRLDLEAKEYKSKLIKRQQKDWQNEETLKRTISRTRHYDTDVIFGTCKEITAMTGVDEKSGRTSVHEISHVNFMREDKEYKKRGKKTKKPKNWKKILKEV